MNNKTFPIKTLKEELKARDFMAYIKRVVDSADELELDAQGVLHLLNRDMEKIELELEVYNNNARDSIVRRELGLSQDDIVTSRHRNKVFDIFATGGMPQS
ncbi:hypothetical protein ACWX0P_27245 [Vibrio mediterranei]